MNINDKCEKCELNCELAQEYKKLVQKYSESSFPVYATRDLVNCVVGTQLKCIPCSTNNVADGIGNDFKIDLQFNDYMKKVNFISNGKNTRKPENYVFISAQTGRGKNYFVENTLLPYVKKLNYDKLTDFKVLIVSNRIALRLQVENRLKGKTNFEDEHEEIYPYKRCADVVSYQGLLKQFDYMRWNQEESRSKYIFIVCDEAHFFTSDSMFNPHTGNILSGIVDVFKDAIRVYMTATPYECLPFINAYENRRMPCTLYKNDHQKFIEGFFTSNVVSVPIYGRGLFYHFTRDYGYLDIKYFSEHDELIDIIQSNGKEKWLVFLDHIDEGKKFKGQLESADGTTEESKEKAKKSKYYAVDASSKKDEKYQKIVLDENLGHDIQVLITTSVLDNGVNFRNIKNVVVSDVSRVKCLQMLGRARVFNNQRITLYVKRLNVKFIKKRLESFETQKDAYHDLDMFDNDQGYEFLEKYYGGKARANDCSNFKNADLWFARYRKEPSKLFQNDIARLMVDELVPIYESIRDEMIDEMAEIDTGKDIIPGQTYLEYQLGWFGKDYEAETDIDADITLAAKSEARKDLIVFLETYVNGKTPLSIYDTAKFSEEFTILYDIAFQREDKNRNRFYSFVKINDLLEKQQLNYKLESVRETTGKKRTYWKVVRFDRPAST